MISFAFASCYLNLVRSCRAQAQSVQRAMGLLQQAAPDYFEVNPMVLQSPLMPKAIKAFRDVIQAYLPADQGQLLMHAAAAVMELYSECSIKTAAETQSAPATSSSSGTASSGASSGTVPGHETDGGGHSDSDASSNGRISKDGEGGLRPVVGGKVVRKRRVSHRKSSNPDEQRLSTSSTASSNIDFTSAEAMADPVGTIFEARETKPNRRLSRCFSGHNVSDGDFLNISARDKDCDDVPRRSASDRSNPHSPVSSSPIPQKTENNSAAAVSDPLSHDMSALMLAAKANEQTGTVAGAEDDELGDTSKFLTEEDADLIDELLGDESLGSPAARRRSAECAEASFMSPSKEASADENVRATTVTEFYEVSLHIRYVVICD